MSITVYDKSKYHSDSRDFPRELPASQASVHIGFFLRWLIEHGLTGTEWRSDFESEVAATLAGAMSPSELVDRTGGVLTSDMLTRDGKAFVDRYYGDYLRDYEALFAGERKTIYEVEDSRENYNRVRHLLDAVIKRWEEQ